MGKKLCCLCKDWAYCGIEKALMVALALLVVGFQVCFWDPLSLWCTQMLKPFPIVLALLQERETNQTLNHISQNMAWLVAFLSLLLLNKTTPNSISAFSEREYLIIYTVNNMEVGHWILVPLKKRKCVLASFQRPWRKFITHQKLLSVVELASFEWEFENVVSWIY